MWVYHDFSLLPGSRSTFPEIDPDPQHCWEVYQRRPGIYSIYHLQNIKFKSTQHQTLIPGIWKCKIKYILRLVGMNVYMISCAPIN